MLDGWYANNMRLVVGGFVGLRRND